MSIRIAHMILSVLLLTGGLICTTFGTVRSTPIFTSSSDPPISVSVESPRIETTSVLLADATMRLKGRILYVNEWNSYSPAPYLDFTVMDEDPFASDPVAHGQTDESGRFDITCYNEVGWPQNGYEPFIQIQSRLWEEWGHWIVTGGGGTFDMWEWETYVCGNNVPNGFFYDYGDIVVDSTFSEVLQAGYAVDAAQRWVHAQTGQMIPSRELGIHYPDGDVPHCTGESIHLPEKSAWFWEHTVVQGLYGLVVLWETYGKNWPAGFTGEVNDLWYEYASPTDAFVRGWEYFFQCAVDNNPDNLQGWYMGHGGNIESNDWYNCVDTGDMDGAQIAGSVTSIFWDFCDHVSYSDNDSMAWGFNYLFFFVSQDRPTGMHDFWTKFIDRYGEDQAGGGPLCTIYWHYGIDKDVYAPDGSIVILDNATYHTYLEVPLALSCTDRGSGVVSMRFRNSISDPWSNWEPYVAAKLWYLSLGDGTKTVSVQFMDGKDLISEFSDTIILDTIPPMGRLYVNEGNPEYTSSMSVTLYVSCSDETSGVESVCYSNSGEPYTNWESVSDWTNSSGLLSSTRTWTLSAGDGTKTVFCKFIDEAGHVSELVSDLITLDTKPPMIGNVTQDPHVGYVQPENEVDLHVRVEDDRSEVKQVILNYTSDGQPYMLIYMTNVGAMYNATIPEFPKGTTVTYTVIAEDNAGNTIDTQQIGYSYGYEVIPEYASFLIPVILMFPTLAALALRKRVHASARVMNARSKLSGD